MVSSSKELKNRAMEVLGELFITGVKGYQLSEETKKFLKESNIGGTIFFAHNYESPAQIAKLSNQIQECRKDLPLWVSVDQEGGRVQRFKKGFSIIPNAKAIGATGSPKLAFEIAELMGRELKAVGVNLDFAPIADIATNPTNPVIGDRSFGEDEETVSKMSSAFVRGLLVSGVQPCMKHFPGHGDTSTDSHFALPRVDTTKESLLEREVVPFMKGFKAKCSLVMTAHIIVSELDPTVPATLSPIVLQDFLRGQLKYKKVIVSDDMEMQAITDHFGAEDAPRMAITAGCDLLIYRTESAARVAYQALTRAIEDETLSSQRVIEAAERCRALKREVLLPYLPVATDKVGTSVVASTSQSVIEQVR